VRENIGYLSENFILYPNLSVKENIDFSASLYGLGWFSRRNRRRQVMEFVDLWDHRHKLARDISGGMQRRLGLASSLIHDPQLIFLDEPTAAIDPILRAKFWGAFRELKAGGRSLLVTTQYVTEAEYCDRVAVLSHGRILAVDTPENLRQRAFGGQIIEVRAPEIGHAIRPLLLSIEGVRAIDTSVPGLAKLVVDDAASASPAVMDLLRQAGIEIQGIEQHRPSFDEVFVRLIEQESEHA
jgi:ABC-2 type transport system ATP-binding protein